MRGGLGSRENTVKMARGCHSLRIKGGRGQEGGLFWTLEGASRPWDVVLGAAVGGSGPGEQSGLEVSLAGRWAVTKVSESRQPQITLAFAFWAQIPLGFLVGPVT